MIVHPNHCPPKGHLFTVNTKKFIVPGNDEATKLELQDVIQAAYIYRLKEAREKFGSFMEYCFYDEMTRTPYRQQWFHDEWSDVWDKEKRAIIIAPRNHGKTSQIVGRVIWELGRNPNLRIKIACAADGRAKERLFEVTQHLEYNKRVKEVFPRLKQDRHAEWSKHKIVVKRDAMHRDASVEALGITATATGGRCVVPGTKIITSTGLTQIENVKKGQRVLGLDGKYHIVDETMSRNYTGDVIKIKVEGSLEPVTLTPEHPVLTHKYNDGLPCYEWTRADELKERDIVLFPRRKNNKTHKIFSNDEQQREFIKLSKTKNFWRILGYFLGDGWVANHEKKKGEHKGRVVFGLNNTTKLNVIKDIKKFCEDTGAGFGLFERENSVEIRVYHVMFSDICRKFRHRAHNKYIPSWVSSSSVQNVREFIRGYILTDGHVIKNKIGVVSTSYNIVTELQLILFGLGYSSHVRVMREEGEDIFPSGKKYKTKKAYILESNDPNFRRFLFSANVDRYKSWESVQRVFFTQNHALIPISDIRKISYSGEVYDLSVPSSRTFVVPNMVVHNCDLLIADDVVDRRNALSFPKLRQQIKQAWKSDWTNLLEPDSKIWYICTLWHKDDLSHELMENPQYKTLFYSIPDNFGSMWPEKWPTEYLKTRYEEIGSVEFNRGFRNQAIDEDTSVIKKDWLKFKDLYSYEEYKERKQYMFNFTSYDTARATGVDSDYSANVSIAVDPDAGKVYVLDAWHGRYTIGKQSSLVYRDYKRFNPFRILIEKVGQAVLDEWVINEHPELQKIIEVTTPRISKFQRLLAVTPLLEQGRVIFNAHLNPARADWTPAKENLIHELEDFPFAKNDDLVDAFSQALHGARRYFLDAWAGGGENVVSISIGGKDSDAEENEYLL